MVCVGGGGGKAVKRFVYCWNLGAGWRKIYSQDCFYRLCFGLKLRYCETIGVEPQIVLVK
jgi:hypothetical protein